MLQGVGAPGAPGLGTRGEGRAVGWPSRQRCGSTHRGDVGGQEAVGVAERPHEDVVGRPRPDAGERDQPGPRLRAVGAAVEDDVTVGQGLRQGDQGTPAGAGHGEGVRVERRDGSGRGEGAHHPVDAQVLGQVVAGELGDETGETVGGDEGDLLAEHGAQRDLVAVDRSRHAQPRASRDQRGEQRVAPEDVGDDQRVGVGVEEPAAALDRRGEVPQVRQPQGHRDGRDRAGVVEVPEVEVEGGRPVREAYGAEVARAHHRLQPGREVTLGEGADVADVVRRADGQPQGDRPRGDLGVPAALTQRPQLGRGRGVDLADGVVELPDAGEPRGERDVLQRPVGRLHEGARVLGALRAGQGEGAGT